jgi:hypothetical protein
MWLVPLELFIYVVKCLFMFDSSPPWTHLEGGAKRKQSADPALPQHPTGKNTVRVHPVRV